jgi:hypothetical protein
MEDFKKAERVRAKVALIGPSGSGKTYSALRLATGIGGRIALINTEGDRGYVYAGEFSYDILDLAAPFTPEKYIEAIAKAEKMGYDVLVIDSGTHEWSGRGGCLEIVDSIPGSNSYIKWQKVTPRHNAFIDAHLFSKCHIIECLRGKDQYVLESDEKGKQTPKKVGLGPEQRTNYEYEFMVTLLIDQQTHIPVATKDNSHIFEGKYELLTEEHGKKLLAWCNSGLAKPLTKPPAPSMPEASNEAGNEDAYYTLMLEWSDEQGFDREDVQPIVDQKISTFGAPANWGQLLAPQWVDAMKKHVQAEMAKKAAGVKSEDAPAEKTPKKAASKAPVIVELLNTQPVDTPTDKGTFLAFALKDGRSLMVPKSGSIPEPGTTIRVIDCVDKGKVLWAREWSKGLEAA